ncbi:MAG: hypothetical protein JO151_06845 [Verrucomicrobia bacterium]|nr:hypothetical protein [Verrucomicrobiota bacterium]
MLCHCIQTSIQVSHCKTPLDFTETARLNNLPELYQVQASGEPDPIRPIVLSSKGVWRARAGVVSLIRTLREEPNTEAYKFVVQ